MRFGRNIEARVSKQAAQSVMEGSVTIRRLGVCVFPRSHLLISLRGKVNVEVVERLAFDVVGVLVAPAVVASESEYLGRLRDEHRNNGGEIQNVDGALPENQAELASADASEVQMLLLVTAFGHHSGTPSPVGRQVLPLLQ